jgi:N-acetylglucosamine-6-phosphate deacetylase
MTPLHVTGDLLLDGRLVPGTVTIDGDRITEVRHGPPDGDAERLTAVIVAPGLIDLQVNGGFGAEVGDDPAAIRRLATRLPEVGVTAFLPTIITSPAPYYPRVFAAFAAARQSPGARALGLHVEGPFLSARRAGAHRLDLIAAADDALFDSILASDDVRLMTLAPERLGAGERIRRLRERGIVASLGHTDASYEELVTGIDAGATMVTHLYNAMSSFAHRAPGVIGAALVDDRVTVGLIADGIHSHPASVRLALRAKGVERIALVSDLMPAAGLPPGRYEFGGEPVIVEGETASRANGTLAGSVVTLDQAVRKVVRWTDATICDALRMASEVPARLLGLSDMGRIAPGSLADLVFLDRELQVEATIVGGQVAWRRGTA